MALEFSSLVTAIVLAVAPAPSAAAPMAWIATAGTGAAAPARALSPAPADLAEQAYQLFGSPGRWEDAAELLVQAAGGLGADPRAVRWIMDAGHAFQAAGRPERARAAYLEAGDLGMTLGAVADAADAYLNAATLALAGGDRGAARELMGKAERLSHSPHLDALTRQRILTRLAR